MSLFTAALDERVAGIAVSCAFTPLRDASTDIEGIKAYSHLYGLLPRLGFFVGHEDKIPLDYSEIISTIAPKPLLVISPKLDRHANADRISQSIEEIASIYSTLDAPNNLEFKSPHEFNEFTPFQQKDFANWLYKISD